MRWCYDRHLQTGVKFLVCSLLAIFYITFLCRESQNAYELNRVKSDLQVYSHVLPQSEIIINKRDKNRGKSQQEEQLLLPLNPFMVTTWTSASTLNPVYEYSEEKHSATEKDLLQRRRHLHRVCTSHQLQNVYPPNPREFFISPGHNLIWCNVFKAASSTWMYYFNILGGYDTKYLQRTSTQPLQLARERFPRPELQELLDCLPSSLSFLFVRDPFERIVSGYRNKLEGGKNTYYKWLSTLIVRRFRKYVAGMGVYPKSGPTFNEFVQFLIEQNKLGKIFDEHWAPIYKFCTPCSVDFNIVGKVETFARDSEFIIRQAGLESLLLDTLPKGKLRKIANSAKGDKSDAVVKSYFAELSHSTLVHLLEIYRLDFELFDYDYKKYFDYVIPESTELIFGATNFMPTRGKVAIYNLTQ